MVIDQLIDPLSNLGIRLHVIRIASETLTHLLKGPINLSP